ncbi:NAD(P)H-dependent oxidoreductase subunit E [bacterium]|nr:NAD(P)H-dependent oxidoreductase subunit E [bacterium]
MLVTERQTQAEEIKALAEKYEKNRSSLMPILQAIQAKYSHISDFAMQEIARHLDIHPVEIYGVISFYAFLRTEQTGKFVIRLCRTLSCDMAGKARVARQLESELGIVFGETTSDGHFTLEYANCLGLCDQGPAMLVNDTAFTGVTPEKVHEIIKGCKRTFSVYAQEGLKHA